ncbi:MAG: hypothetical protein HC880_20235 [Bacteroidia bacterium]|nr:hypothetical protein [Bacteroidia bacterium]
MKVFETSYASIFIEKDLHLAKVVWKKTVPPLQFKLALDMIVQLVAKEEIKAVAEDQRRLFVVEGQIKHWLYRYYFPQVTTSLQHYLVVASPRLGDSLLKNAGMPIQWIENLNEAEWLLRQKSAALRA